MALNEAEGQRYLGIIFKFEKTSRLGADVVADL